MTPLAYDALGRGMAAIMVEMLLLLAAAICVGSIVAEVVGLLAAWRRRRAVPAGAERKDGRMEVLT